VLARVGRTATEAVSPLERLETALHPWVAFIIMPIFALANAGVHIEPAALGHPVALAVAAGLAIGKPVGIVLFSWVAVRFGLARLPEGVNWKVMIGAGCLAGIGFTMSLFIASLALKDDPELLDAGKIGTLTGSALSAVLGSVLLLLFLPRRADNGAGQPGQS
jgi:NhaA family Na+:H+ antiporter